MEDFSNENQKLNGEDLDEPLVERIIRNYIHFALQPRNAVILVMALKFAIEKANIYKSEMICIHDYIIKTALEQQKEEDFNNKQN